jgi:hypothetical protein
MYICTYFSCGENINRQQHFSAAVTDGFTRTILYNTAAGTMKKFPQEMIYIYVYVCIYIIYNQIKSELKIKKRKERNCGVGYAYEYMIIYIFKIK